MAARTTRGSASADVTLVLARVAARRDRDPAAVKPAGSLLDIDRHASQDLPGDLLDRLALLVTGMSR